MYSKEEKIKVYVMVGTIIMLLVIFSGITYAFFSASNNQGSTSLIEATSGKMLISYKDGTSDLLVSKDIQPSNNIIIDKTFTLTGTNTTSGLTMPYKVGLKYTSTFSDDQIHYYIKEINRPNSSEVTVEYTGETNQTVQGNSSYTGYSHGTLKKGNNYTEMVTGKFSENTSNQTITFNLILQFPDTGENQDSEKGKEINGKVVVNEKNISEYISSLNFTENGLEQDDTADKNIRYVGASPKNYITFNNDSWRIIGIFNVYNTETNQNEDLVKIVRNASISNNAYNTDGVNGWKNASLNKMLNEEYYANIITKEIIANISWNIGNINSSKISVLESYNEERTQDIWNGKIGLIYPSDYGYASTDTECKKMIEHNGSTTSYCKNNNWLHTNQTYWTITSSSVNENKALRIAAGSGIYNENTTAIVAGTRPTLFLKSTVQIFKDDGSSNNPYIIN